MASSTSIGFDIIAKDRASDKFQKIGSTAERTGSRFAKMGKAAGVGLLALTGGAVLVGKALVGMTKNALEDQEAHRRLAIALKNTTNATDAQVSSVEKWISAQGVALGVTDDELRPALQRLVQATGSISKAQKLASLAMDVSAGSGKSLKTVTEALSKAQLGSVGGLARLGAKTKDAEGKTLSLQKITRSLADTFKGQAAKAADSATGKFNRLKLMFDETKEAIGYRLLPIASALAGFLLQKMIPAFDQAGGKIKEFGGKVKDALGKMHFGDIAGKIKDAFSKIDIGNLGTKLATQAKSWAAPVIDGFKQGLDTGDWSGLGTALGNGVVKALAGAGAIAGKLTGKFSDLMAKVDWVGIGIAMGKQAPSLMLGLAAGILNFDLMGLLRGVAKHWQDVLLAVIAIAFTPGRVIGKVAEMLAKIPFAGKMLAWGLLAFKRFADGMVKQVFRAMGFLGKAFLTGFRRVFPGVGAGFAKALEILPLRIAVMAIELQAKGARMILGLGRAIAGKIGSVVAAMGELAGKLLKPFAGAASWLLSAGRNIVGGLLSGIRSMAGSIVSTIKSSITDKIPSFVKKAMGIFSPSKVMAKLGVNIMEGLQVGLEKGSTKVKAALDKVMGYISSQRDKLKSLMSAKSSFAQGFQSFTSSVFGADLSHTTTDAAGNETTTPGSIADILAYQADQAQKARGLRADVSKLHKMGLSNALIQQLQSSGESGMAQIHTLAGGSRADIQRLNALNRQTAGALNSAGQIAGGQLYNASIQQTRQNEDLAERIAKKLHDALREAAKNEELVIKDTNGQWIIKAIRKDKRTRGQSSSV